jgi:hypothetical protein
MKIREVEHANGCVAFGQNRDLRLAKYVTHDYRRIVEHEKIKAWD